MDFEDWTRAVHSEFDELRERARRKRKMVAIWTVGAIFLLGVALFAAFVK